MKAVYFEAAGDPLDVLKHGEIPAPQRDNAGVRVKVNLRTIQPADMAFIRGRYRIQPVFPQAAGLEGMGVVAAASPETGFSVGQRVAFRAAGAWADEVEVPLNRLIPVLDDIADEDAAQMALNPVTAWALLQESGASEGDAVAMTAGASTVSGLIAQIARGRGIRTIGVVRGGGRPEGQAVTDAVVTSEGDDVADRIRSAAAGRPVTALIDSVGGLGLTSLIPALSAGGRILAYGVMDPAPAAVTNAMLIYSNLTWSGFGIDRWLDAQTTQKRDEMFAALWSAVRAGGLQLPVAARFPLAEFQEAIRADAKSGRPGKILLT